MTLAQHKERELHAERGPSWLYKGRVPCLDGIRGIAILLVLLNHACRSGDFTPPFAVHLLSRLHIGIDTFLITSGFLITLLFIREHEKTGTINVRHFYYRRVIRLFPAYVAFIGVLYVASRAGAIHLSGGDWRGLLTHTINFLPAPSHDIGHIWSLSMQEHFYVFFPLLLVWLGPKRLLPALVGLMLFLPVLRTGIWFAAPQFREMLPFWTFTRCDTVAMGCLLALLAAEPAFRQRTLLPGKKALWMGVGLVGALLASSLLAIKSPLFVVTVGYLVRAVCIAGIVWLCINHDASRTGRLLKTPVLTTMGVMCYSIYLWQQSFFNPHYSGWAFQWPVNLVFVALCAVFSYHVLEKPFMNLKDLKRPDLSRLRRRSSPHPVEEPQAVGKP